MQSDARERLDHYLVRLGWARSRRAAREMLASGMVRVNGRVLRKGETVGGGDSVDISEISALPAVASDPEVKIEVLFRDPSMYRTAVASVGDQGAATVPLNCVLAARAWARSYGSGPTAVVFGASWAGARGALLLQQPGG